MTACNSHKCHCPACLASREDRLRAVEMRVANVDQRTSKLELRESNRDMFAMDAARRAILGTGVQGVHNRHPDQHVSVRGSRVIRQTRTGNIYQGWDSLNSGPHPTLIWRWREHPMKPSWWRKFDEREGVFFGAPWRYPMRQFNIDIETRSKRETCEITFTDDTRVGDIRKAKTITISNPTAAEAGWLRSRFTGEVTNGPFDTPVFSAGGFVGREHYAELRRRPPWKGAGDWLCENVETRRDHKGNTEYAMTPFMLEILLHAYGSVDFFSRIHAPAYPDSFRKLESLGLIEVTSGRERIECKTHVIKATTKGRVYVKAMLDLPLPVQAEPQWSMPA